jgi:RimJ/RimL family protein N-acetyltransferase
MHDISPFVSDTDWVEYDMRYKLMQRKFLSGVMVLLQVAPSKDRLILSELLIKIINDPMLLREYFLADKALYAYALGDLSEPMWSISTFTGAFEGDTLRAVSLVWAGVEPPVFLAFGTPNSAAKLLRQAPERHFCMLPELLYPTYAEVFELPKKMELWRMSVNPQTFTPPTKEVQGLRRLTGADVSALQALYQRGSGGPRSEEVEAFTAAQIEQGIFWAIEQDHLEAVAGTHVFSLEEGIGAIGFVFTAEASRGKGYSKAVTAAVTQSLFEIGIELVILNVVKTNLPAIRVYEQLGFVAQHSIFEGHAHKK